VDKKMLVIGMIALVSCAPVDTHNLPGTYEARVGGITEILVLRADGTYTVTQVGGRAHRGEWQALSRSRGCQRIILESFSSQIEDQGRPYIQSGEDWSTCVDKSIFGKTRIVMDADVGAYYIRQGG